MKHRKPGKIEDLRERLRNESRQSAAMSAVSKWPSDIREEFEERAAIMEYCGGLQRDVAELRAFEIVRKNDAFL